MENSQENIKSYSQQQQAVILKGIAQQILQMSIPTFDQANKILIEFNLKLDYNTPYEGFGDLKARQ